MYLTNLGITEEDLKNAMVTGRLSTNEFNSSNFDAKSRPLHSKTKSSFKKRAKYGDKLKKYRKSITLKNQGHSSIDELSLADKDSNVMDSSHNDLESYSPTNKILNRSISLGSSELYLIIL